MIHVRFMKNREKEYESPEMEVLYLAPERPVASSPLENPLEGEIWSWD